MDCVSHNGTAMYRIRTHLVIDVLYLKHDIIVVVFGTGFKQMKVRTA